MKSILQYAAVVGAVMAATAGSAFAAPPGLNVPEPGTLALVGAAVAALVFISRKNKK